jgi:hypothetical protein
MNNGRSFEETAQAAFECRSFRSRFGIIASNRTATERSGTEMPLVRRASARCSVGSPLNVCGWGFGASPIQTRVFLAVAEVRGQTDIFPYTLPTMRTFSWKFRRNGRSKLLKHHLCFPLRKILQTMKTHRNVDTTIGRLTAGLAVFFRACSLHARSLYG